jgi:hypothetical protein
MFCVYEPPQLFRFACCFKPLRLDKTGAAQSGLHRDKGIIAGEKSTLVTVQVDCQ